MLPEQSLGFRIAHDPGAGKTITAGRLIKNVSMRNGLAHCLAVAPTTLAAQWHGEPCE